MEHTVEDETDGYQEEIYIAEVAIFVILVPIIICSNILIIAAPVFVRQLRTPDNWLMVNLAVADLLIGTVSIPLKLLSMSSYENPIHNMEATIDTCHLLQSLEYFPFSLSLSTLVIMSVDRCIAIKWPFYYDTSIGNCKLTLAILFIWILSLAKVAISRVYFQFDNTVLPLGIRCSHKHNVPHWIDILHGTFVCVSVGLSGVLTAIVIFKVIRIRRVAEKLLKNVSMSSNKNYDTNLCGTSSSIFLHIVLWTPHAVGHFLPHSSFHQDYMCIGISWIPVGINAACNAFVYAYNRQRNRAAYLFMLRNWPWNWPDVSIVISRQLRLVLMQRRNSFMVATFKELHTIPYVNKNVPDPPAEVNIQYEFDFELTAASTKRVSNL